MRCVLVNIDNKNGEKYIFTLLEDPDHGGMGGNVANFTQTSRFGMRITSITNHSGKFLHSNNRLWELDAIK